MGEDAQTQKTEIDWMYWIPRILIGLFVLWLVLPLICALGALADSPLGDAAFKALEFIRNHPFLDLLFFFSFLLASSLAPYAKSVFAALKWKTSKNTKEFISDAKNDAERKVNEKIVDKLASEMRRRGSKYVESQENRSKIQKKLMQTIENTYRAMTEEEQEQSELRGEDGKFDKSKAEDKAKESMDHLHPEK